MPMIHLCPHCNKPCLSSLQKMSLSSMNSVSCQSCGQPVSTPRIYLIVQFIVLIIGLLTIKALALGPASIIVVGIVLAVLLLIFQLRFVPLVKTGYPPNTD